MGLLNFLFGGNRETANDVIGDGESRWWSSAAWGADTPAGERVTSENILTSSTCFACTKALSETIAGLPGIVYRSLENDRKVADPNQSAWSLLVDQPNPEMDAFTFWELATTRVVNAGNFFAEIQRDRADRPIGLWPIHPSRVRPKRDPEDHSLYWEVTYDYQGTPEYSDPSWRANYVRYLSSHNMLNIVGFGSQNGIISPGVLPGAPEIGIEFAARKYGSEFFANGAMPVGIVEHPGWMPRDEQRAQFRNDLNKIHSSARHQMAVLWQGAKYNPISVSPEQAQMLETRQFTAHQICSMYGVPPAIIGDYSDNKFATADAMIRAFVMITLRNLVVRLEKAIYRQVLNVKRDGGMKRAFAKPLIYRIALDGLLRGDPKTQAEALKIYRDIGVYSANNVLDALDQNRIEGAEGDYRIIPGGFQRLDQVDSGSGHEVGGDGDPQGTATSNEPPEPVAFDRATLAAAIVESGLAEESRTTVRGHSPAADMLDVAVTLATDAVSKIHGITRTQADRWRTQDPAEVASKMTGFWDKQQQRLHDALGPVSMLVEKATGSPSHSARAIAGAYADICRRQDAHSVFDFASSEPVLDPKTYIEVELCCTQ